MQARSRVFTVIELLVVTAMLVTLPWLAEVAAVFN